MHRTGVNEEAVPRLSGTVSQLRQRPGEPRAALEMGPASDDSHRPTEGGLTLPYTISRSYPFVDLRRIRWKAAAFASSHAVPLRRVRLGKGLALLFSGGTFRHDQIFRDIDCRGRIVNGTTDNRPEPRRSGRLDDVGPNCGFPLHQQPLILRLTLRRQRAGRPQRADVRVHRGRRAHRSGRRRRDRHGNRLRGRTDNAPLPDLVGPTRARPQSTPPGGGLALVRSCGRLDGRRMGDDHVERA